MKSKRWFILFCWCMSCILVSAQMYFNGPTPLEAAEELTASGLQAADEGAYADAEQDLLEALHIRLEVLGKNHSLYLASLNNIAALYNKTRQFDQAEKYYTEALEIRKEVSGETHPDYAVLLNNLSSIYREQGRYAEAMRSQQEALRIQEQLQGKHTQSYAVALNNLSQICKETGEYAQAAAYCREAVEIGREVFGEDDSRYATFQNNLGLILNLTGDYNSAIRHQKESLDGLRRAKGENTPEYALALNNLANIYADKGDYPEAERYYQQALGIQRATLGAKHPEYAATLNNLAAVFDARGQYEEAKKYYTEALRLRRESLGEKHPDYATSLNNLGVLYVAMTDYAKAEQCYLQALNIRREVLGESHPDYALSLNNLGALYIAMGDFARADSYFRMSLAIKQRSLGMNHPDFAISLNNMAMLCNEQGQLRQAEHYYQQALEIQRRSYGENHPAYATTLGNMAVLYDKMNNYRQAERYYHQVLKIMRETVGERHIDYARTLNNIGALYSNHGDYRQAEQYYNQALDIWRKVFGENHPGYAILLDNIAQEKLLTGNADKAQSLYIRSAGLYKEMYLNSLDFMSEKQRASYWSVMQNKFAETYPVFVLRYSRTNPSVTSFAYDNELFIKGLLLNSSSRIRRSILESGDSQLVSRWNALNDAKRLFMTLQEKDPQSQEIPVQRQRIEGLEKQLISSSAMFRENRELWKLSWQDIRRALKPKQVAIEFFQAPLKEDSVVYCALLLRHDSESPVLVPLFEQHEAQRLINTATEGFINQTYSAEDNGKKLSALVWEPLMKYLHAGEAVFFAPTGLLHQLAIEALPYNDDSSIGDLFDMVRLSSTREILFSASDIRHTSATLYGGISYDSAPYLPGTLKEVEEIGRLLRGNSIDVQLITAAEADKASFHALSGRKRSILHVATHGFFRPDTMSILRTDTRNRATQMNTTGVLQTHTADPLTRCGLLFAGANDAILTAKEISLIDLRDANLVVLSACETGKGEVTGEEVFGLQRAFKIAGAKTIIMSLWPVNDAATRMLMTEFYRNWLQQGQTKRQAFRNAQNAVRKTYEEPVYWAGFILLD